MPGGSYSTSQGGNLRTCFVLLTHRPELAELVALSRRPGQLHLELEDTLNKSVTWVFIPPVVPAKAGTSVHNILGSCLRRNDRVKAPAFNDLFRVSLTPRIGPFDSGPALGRTSHKPGASVFEMGHYLLGEQLHVAHTPPQVHPRPHHPEAAVGHPQIPELFNLSDAVLRVADDEPVPGQLGKG